ncbi:T9SS type A sorting domain-containing protein [bacterium]|nr:T9SS type A sorting domain-containing protein [bacterium]
MKRFGMIFLIMLVACSCLFAGDIKAVRFTVRVMGKHIETITVAAGTQVVIPDAVLTGDLHQFQKTYDSIRHTKIDVPDQVSGFEGDTLDISLNLSNFNTNEGFAPVLFHPCFFYAKISGPAGLSQGIRFDSKPLIFKFNFADQGFLDLLATCGIPTDPVPNLAFAKWYFGGELYYSDIVNTNRLYEFKTQITSIGLNCQIVGLWLEENPFIKGQVFARNSAGTSTPIAGATVQFFREGENTAEFTLNTTARGEYYQQVPKGWAGSVTAYKNGLNFEGVGDTTVTDIQRDQLISFESSVISIKGNVHDQDGSPLSNVKVRTQINENSIEVYTNSDGAYEFWVPYGWRGVKISDYPALFRATITPSLANHTFQPEKKEYNSPVYENENGVDFVGFRKPIVTVIVTDSSGNFYPGITIKENGYQVFGTTGNNGQVVKEKRWNWSGSLSVSMQDYLIAPSKHVLNGVKQDTVVTFYLTHQPWPVIDGYVLLPDSTPVPNLYLFFSSLSNSKSDDNGYFQKIVPYGWSGNITFNHPQYEYVTGAPSFAPVYQDTTLNYDIKLKNTFLVQVRLYDRYGRNYHIGGVQINFDTTVTRFTNSSGYCSQTLPRGWSGILQPLSDDYTFNPSEVMITDLNEEKYLYLTAYPVVEEKENYRLDGMITDSSQVPIPDVRVTMTCQSGSIHRTTNGSGEFTYEVNEDFRNIKLIPFKPGYSFEPLQAFWEQLYDDTTFQFCAIHHDFLTVNGKVTNINGMGMDSVAVKFVGNPLWSKTVLTDADGEYQVRAPYNWKGEVYAQKEGYLCNRTFMTQALKQDCIENFQLNYNPTISGLVTDNLGQVIQGVIVKWKRGGAETQVKTDSTGQYAFVVPYNSTGTLKLEASNWMFLPLSVTISGCKSNSVYDFTGTLLAPPVIAGYVIDQRGKGVPGVGIRFNSTEQDTTLFSDANGYYTYHCPTLVYNGRMSVGKPEYQFTVASKYWPNLKVNTLFGFTAKTDLGKSAGDFAVTTLDYPGGADRSIIMDHVFNGSHRLATWQDIVNYYQHDGDIPGLFNLLGNGGHGDQVFVSHQGQTAQGQGQYYVISNSQHQLPGGFTSIGMIDNHLFDLGITGTSRQILAVKTTYDPATGVEEQRALPQEYMLHQNYPNPFNPTTTICYEVPVSGEVSMDVYNIQGGLVKELFSKFIAAGTHIVQWDATDDSGIKMPTGLYLLRFKSGNYIEVKRMLLLK